MQQVFEVNPEWGCVLLRFVEEYPEFKPYVEFAPLHAIEPIPYPNIRSLFDAVLHYICAVGVRYDYAVKQWDIIHAFLETEDWEMIRANMENLRTNPAIQPKKRDMYANVCAYMNQQGLTHRTLNTSHLSLLQKNVKGVGEGCVAWCKKYFTMDDDCVEHTDRGFIQGFERVYGKDHSSLAHRRQKVEEWKAKGLGRMGGLMVLQIKGYA